MHLTAEICFRNDLQIYVMVANQVCGFRNSRGDNQKLSLIYFWKHLMTVLNLLFFLPNLMSTWVYTEYTGDVSMPLGEVNYAPNKIFMF